MAAFGPSLARLHYLSSAAISILGKVMMAPATPPSIEVRAADSIWGHTVKVIEIEDIEARVAAPEEAAQKTGGNLSQGSGGTPLSRADSGAAEAPRRSGRSAV